MQQLQALIKSLQGLSSQVFSRLLQGRLQGATKHATARPSLPIRALLADQVARNAATSMPASNQALGPESEAGSSPTDPSTAHSATPSFTPPKPGVSDALAKQFELHRSSARLEPFMREKMRSTTLDHINKALSLARDGNAQGANIHAELAESAMRTAAEYMSDDEYRQLREEVEARLHASNGAR